jgi:hypothetical protein
MGRLMVGEVGEMMQHLEDRDMTKNYRRPFYMVRHEWKILEDGKGHS